MSNENRLEGTARNIGGKLQEVAGSVTDDALTQVKGKATQAAGAAQDVYGQTVDEIKTITSTKPVASLLAAMGIGMVLGFSLRRR